MNYLAHAFLSKNNPDLLVGNFIADHVRGNNFHAYPQEVIKGIMMHRKIDSFTDSHPDFKKSKRLFYEGFEKYSGILVDIYFDYFLARNFNKYSPIPLEKFSKEVYKVYSDHVHVLPKSSSGFLEYVIKNNVYSAYGTLEGIERVLYHLSHRIKHEIRLDNSVLLFKKNETLLQEHFDLFFNDIRTEFGV
jgi:acyl carrier protein phosphodiesterase